MTANIHAIAARDRNTTHVVFWNFGGAATEVSVRLPAGQAGQFRFVQLDPTANRLDTLRDGRAAELDVDPLRLQIAPYGVAWAHVGG